jgi:hypothetical protein
VTFTVNANANSLTPGRGFSRSRRPPRCKSPPPPTWSP